MCMKNVNKYLKYTFLGSQIQDFLKLVQSTISGIFINSKQIGKIEQVNNTQDQSQLEAVELKDRYPNERS